MARFVEIPAAEWERKAQGARMGSAFMETPWERTVATALPFVTFRHFRYGDAHLVRVGAIGARLTTAPFSEGSDVVALGEGPLDLATFQSDVEAHFGSNVRLRVNERFCPIAEGTGAPVVAHEHIVSLNEPILPRVRKTLRHVLAKPAVGTIQISEKDRDVDAAYQLYVRHMRRVRNFALPKQAFVSLIKEHGGELWVGSRGSSVDAMAVFLPTRNEEGKEDRNEEGDEVLYSLSAANASAFAAHLPHHLVYTALEHYREEGLTRASLGTTGIGSPLAVFKRGWRGEEHRIVELGARHGGVQKSSRVRDLVRLVPLPLYPSLTKILGKRFL